VGTLASNQTARKSHQARALTFLSPRC
jgi:hypothetical protein